ncbi:MAG: RimK family alpha-L-glutamate ligase [Alphaproteobacteria bacterium]|nr:RimK family alpha-L-glutamate ligase [Alphaproteobacteria bacterium]
MLDNLPPTSSTPVSPDGLNAGAPHGPLVVIFIEEGGGDWHAKRLKDAMERRGARVMTSTLRACSFDTSLASGIDIPGLGGRLPDGVFVRSISKGALEAITLRLGVLHALSASGVRVWNEARVIERCVDKSTATFLFQKAGLPVPATRTAEGRDMALAYAKERLPLVSKPLFGSQGNGVKRVDQLDDLPGEEDVGGVYYLQRYLRTPEQANFSDWRVFVSGGRILGSMVRQGTHWITNIHQGAHPQAANLEEEASELALAAARAVAADYAGVDLIRDQLGQLQVLEINSNPAWKGLQSICEVDIADALASDFLTAVAAQTVRNEAVV